MLVNKQGLGNNRAIADLYGIYVLTFTYESLSTNDSCIKSIPNFNYIKSPAQNLNNASLMLLESINSIR